MKTCSRLGAFAALVLIAVAPVRAQYDQLLEDPSLLEKRIAAEKAPASAAPPVPRLLSPALHRDRIRHIDQSPDGLHLITLDAQVLKIWDVEHRAAIVSYHQDPRGTHPFLRQELMAAWFTAVPRQIVVCTNQQILVFDDFDFSKPRASYHKFEPTAYHFDLANNRVFTATFDAKKLRLGLSRLDLVEGKESTVGSIDFGSEKLKPTGSTVSPAWPQPFTISADGRLAGFGFQGENPFFLIDLSSGEITARVPATLGAVGLLPDSRVLGRTLMADRNVISVVNPVTHDSKPLLEIPNAQPVILRLPERATDPLAITYADKLWVHDFATGQTSSGIQTAQCYTDAVLTLRDGRQGRLLVARSTRNQQSGVTAATYLDFFDPVAGVFRARWTEPTFAVDELYARADDFDFIVRNAGIARRVRLTEAGIVSEPLTYPSSVLGQARGIYDDTSEQWLLVGGAKPRLGVPDPNKPGEYQIFPLGPDSYLDDAGRYTYSLNNTFFIGRSRDGRVLALHHGNGVTIVDVSTRKRTAFFKIETSVSYAQGDRQCLALSPDGETVAYSYVVHRDNQWLEWLECRDIATGALKWRHPREDNQSKIQHLKFSADGRLLFLTGRDVLGRFESLYTATGEVAGRISGNASLLVYNRAGTLVAQAGGKELVVRTLPAGDLVARVSLPAVPQKMAFVGSDRFLLVNANTDEVLRLIDLREPAVVAEISLFEAPQKWLVRHPATGLFSSEASLQGALQFVQGEQITPLASYFDEFYRPRLLGSLVKGLSPRPTVSLADLRYAPKLTLSIDGPSTRGLSVEDEFETFELPAAKVTLKLAASCEGSPLADLRIYHNGKLVSGATRGLSVEDDDGANAPPAEVFTKTATHTFALTPGKNRFRAVAINAQGTESAPDELVVFSNASAPATETAGIALHVVVVGVNAYRNSEYNLNYARADAEAVAKTLRTGLGSLFARTQHYTLFDAEATRENILATLDAVKREAGPRDVFVFYYAGHGVMSADGADPEFYLAPHEITQLYGERRVLRQLGISSRELLAYSRDIAAQKQLFILDACQSAGALKDVVVRGAVEERAIAQLARSSGTHWLTATGSEQFATEFKKLGHGAFTKVLLDALNGAADAGDGIVTVNELKAYLEVKVPELTAAEKGSAQYPVTYGYGQDFPVGIRSM